MVTRNWKAVVQIGGTVAASLPSSARKATQELERLTTAQRIDSREARKLGGELKTLRKGTQEYKTALAQQASVKTRTAERSVRIRELGERAQASGGSLGRFGGVMGRIGPYGAAAAAGVGVLGGALFSVKKLINDVAREQRGLTLAALPVGSTAEEVDRLGEAFRAALGDADQARKAAQSFLATQQLVRQQKQGDIEGIGQTGHGAFRAGIATETLATGSIFEVADAFRKATAEGANFDRQVAGLRQAGFSDQAIQTVVLMARKTDVATQARKNFNAASVATQADRETLRDAENTLGDFDRRFNEAKRAATVGFLTSASAARPDDEGLEGPGRVAGAAAKELLLKGPFVVAPKLAGQALTKASDYAAGQIIRGGDYAAGQLIRGADYAADQISRGVSELPGSLRGLFAGRPQGAQQPIPPELPEQPQAVRPEAAQPAPVAAPQAAVRPEAAQPAPVAAPQAAVRPEAAQPAPVAAPQAAVRPEAAQPAPVAAPQAAVRPQAAQPAPVAAPQAAVPRSFSVEQHNTYVIDGSADPTAMLIAAEESSLRMIRELA